MFETFAELALYSVKDSTGRFFSVPEFQLIIGKR